MSLRGKLSQLGIEAVPGAATSFPNGMTTAGAQTVTGNQTVSGNQVVGGTLTIAGNLTPAGSIVRTGQQYVIPATAAKVGATAGWTVNAADDISLATCPASQTASTLVIPVTIPLKVGSTITGFSVVGQIESAGNAATLDAALWKHTTAAADVAAASVGAITQVSVTADAAVAAAKTGLTEVVAATETFFVLLTATTAASTDIAIQGITLTISEL